MNRPFPQALSRAAALLPSLIFVALFVVAIALFGRTDTQPEEIARERSATTSTRTTAATSTEPEPARAATTATSTPEKKKSAQVAAAASTPAATAKAPRKASAESDDRGYAERIESPYSTPPLSFDTVNTAARASLVNILCTTRNGSLVRPISGSGTLIDSRGVILTNAHVAQYVLLAQDGRIGLECSARTGSPASAQWGLRVLYLPPAWMAAHAHELLSSRPLGTGEHDYALLLATESLSGGARPATFPFIPVDTREAVGFVEDHVLVAGYPAEFLGSLATANNLFAATSVTTIRQLMTFTTGSVDVMSLGGVIQAQSGSSGGAVVNQWGRLIGVVTTTSEGATTAERDLRAVTLSYINRDMRAQSGSSLTQVLSGDPFAYAADFSTRAAPALTQLLLKQIMRR